MITSCERGNQGLGWVRDGQRHSENKGQSWDQSSRPWTSDPLDHLLGLGQPCLAPSSWQKLLGMGGMGALGLGGNSGHLLPGSGPGVRAHSGPSGQGRRAALPGATPAAAAPVSTSAAASPAPEKTGSAQSPQEACVRSLPAPGPLQNANSPVTTGTTPRQPGRSAARSAPGAGPSDFSPHLPGPGLGRCPTRAGGRPRGAGGLGFGPPAFLWVLSPIPQRRLNQAPSGHREIRIWGQGSQRSRLSGLRVSAGGLFDGLRPDRAPSASLPRPRPQSPPPPQPLGAVCRQPHTCHTLSARPQPFPTETEPAPGVLPPGQPWGGRERGWETLLVHPTCADSPLLYGSRRRGSPFGRRWESRRACTAPAPRTARKREESRAFHGYNKSKGEVGAGEIRNFPTLGTGTCQAAAPGTPGLSLLLPASLAGGWGAG